MAEAESESSPTTTTTSTMGDWTLWKLKKESGSSWSDSTSFEVVGHVNSYEELDCEQYSGFLCPNRSLQQQESYFLFKRGIEPRWEDSANVNGGRWVHIDELNRRGDFRADSRANRVDEQWRFLLKSVLAMQKDPAHSLHSFYDEINGVQADIRFSRYRIGVWSRSKSREHEIGRILNGQDGHFGFPFTSPTCAKFMFKAHEP